MTEKLSILENQRRPERSSIPLQAQIQEERSCECVLNFQSQARLYDPNTTLSYLKNRPDSLRYRSRQHRSRLTVIYFIIFLLLTILLLLLLLMLMLCFCCAAVCCCCCCWSSKSWEILFCFNNFTILFSSSVAFSFAAS